MKFVLEADLAKGIIRLGEGVHCTRPSLRSGPTPPFANRENDITLDRDASVYKHGILISAGKFVMERMVVVTPSYQPDFELCLDLNRSFLEFAPSSVEHHILVPRRDFAQFSQLANPRTRIRCREDLLPQSFVRVPSTDCLLNLHWPFLPVRGWIEQQLVKLAAASSYAEAVVLLVDSDVRFVRPFSARTFVRDGVVRFYRQPGSIDSRFPRHIKWHECARDLLGLPPVSPPYDDYISSMIACDPSVVRKMLERVEATTGLAWAAAISRCVHFSEWTLYGVFVDEIAGSPANDFASDRPLCPGDWTTRFTKEKADEFLARLDPDDVAAMLSSKTGTSVDVRRAAFANWTSTFFLRAGMAAAILDEVVLTPLF